jgi:hypothetical protein
MNLANEGLEARKKEEEVASKKRKAEEDKSWEGVSCNFFPSITVFMIHRPILAHRNP